MTNTSTETRLGPGPRAGAVPHAEPKARAADGAPGAMWGGRFASGPGAIFREINDSLPIDWRLVDEDITGSVVWAWALERAGVLRGEEAARLHGALESLRTEAAATVAPPTDSGAEDVHTWVEQRLVASLGDLGKKLHTGRSRNDQVATDLRLWARKAIGARLMELRFLRSAIIALAEREHGAIMPGYTHLQRAQPILTSHWALAYEEMLSRDAGRLRDALGRLDECPLGSGALAGSGFPVDREWIAHELGFARATRNSLDAVSDRDFVIEAIGALELLAIHLSRLAEELVIYSTSEFAFVTMGDDVTSGSSLMPQKKNPDAMELVRAKSAAICARRVAMAMTMKGLPLSYNKDMQEDKANLFAAMDDASLCLRATTRVLDTLKFDRTRCETQCARGHLGATDLADELVRRGTPFRDAHHTVGALVREADARGVELDGLDEAVLRAHDVDPSMVAVTAARRAVQARGVSGGTSPVRVAESIGVARSRLEEEG